MDRGEILFEKQEKLGVVFQEPRLMPWLTLEQNILFGADKKKYSKIKLKERAEAPEAYGFGKIWKCLSRPAVRRNDAEGSFRTGAGL